MSLLGPVLIGGVAEAEMKHKLASVFVNRLREKTRRDALNPYIRDEDFQRIKLQLRALGIIGEVEGPAGTNKHWTLTPYGDTLMTQVAAIRPGRR